MISKQECIIETKEFLNNEANTLTDFFFETFDIKNPESKRELFNAFFKSCLTDISIQTFASTMILVENICKAYETMSDTEFKIYLLEISSISKQFEELKPEDLNDK